MLSSKVKGSVFLSLVIVIWVGSAVLIRSLLTSSSTSFDKPFFLTYYNTCFFTVYLLPFLRTVWLVKRDKGSGQETGRLKKEQMELAPSLPKDDILNGQDANTITNDNAE